MIDASKEPFTWSASGARMFLGDAYMKLGKDSLAREAYLDCIRDFPLAYYAHRSRMKLVEYGLMDAANVPYAHGVQMTPEQERRAKRSVWAFLFGVALVVLFGSVPSLRPSFELADGTIKSVSMSETIEMVMMAVAALILWVGKVDVSKAANGSVFGAGMNAMVSIFGIAWMGDTYFSGHLDFYSQGISTIVTQMPMLFAVALFFMSIMLFSQAATVRTVYPLGIALGINPMLLIAMFPACNGYFFLPNYPTEVAAINFDQTGTTKAGKYVINHSFQLSGFITTFVSIGIAYLTVVLFY